MVREKQGVKKKGVETGKRRGGRLGKRPQSRGMEDDIEEAVKTAARALDAEQMGADMHPHPKLDCLLNLGAMTPSGDLSPSMKALLRGDHGRDVLVVLVDRSCVTKEDQGLFASQMAGLGWDTG